MKLVIETWWNKVITNPAKPFGTQVLPEYELKQTVTFKDSGWTVDAWRRSVQSRHGFMGWEGDKAKFDLGTYYNIHSYQLVSLEP